MLEKKVEQANKIYGVAIVDMQPDYLSEFDFEKREALVFAQQTVLDICSEEDIPVLVIEMKCRKKTIPELRKKLKKLRYRHSSKYSLNGFANRSEGAKYFLDQWGVTDLCFMGVYASVCVHSTAKGSLNHGFKPITAEQLIADPWEGDFNEVKTWFTDNGKYLSNYLDLMTLLKNS